MSLKGKFPERYAQLIDFYVDGKANALDILKADFVEWPPRPLDIVHPPEFEVRFKSTWSTANAYKPLAPSLTGTGLNIFLITNYPIFGTLFLFAYTALKAFNLGGFVSSAQSDTVHVNDLYRLFTATRGGRKTLSHIISHEFKHVVQFRDRAESLSSSLDNKRMNLIALLKTDASSRDRYLADEAEVQARMHTMLVGAYHQYEHLPTSRAELFECLFAQGVDVPEDILAASRKSPNGRSAQEVFIAPKQFKKEYADDDAVNDLNSLIKAIKPSNSEHFWKAMIPFIYGDLLELWGDRLGHRRMGHTHNIQLREVFYRCATDVLEHQQKTSQALGRVRQTTTEFPTATEQFERLKKVVAVMHKDDAVDLACMLLVGIRYKELAKSRYAPFVTGNRLDEMARTALGIVLKRPDLTRSDMQALKKAQQLFSSRNRSLELASMRCADGTLIETLRAA